MRVPTLISLVVSGVALLACAPPQIFQRDVAAVPGRPASSEPYCPNSGSTAPAPRPKPAFFVIKPEALVALDEQEMLEILGRPPTIPDEPPAMVWSYTADKCSLDIFFYRNVANNTSRSRAYTVTTAQKTETAKRACL